MFQYKSIRAYVCQDVFVYHMKSATASPGTREAMEKNKMQVSAALGPVRCKHQ